MFLYVLVWSVGGVFVSTAVNVQYVQVCVIEEDS